MAYRTSIFIDFWNFSLQWRNRAHGDLIDWRKVPAELLGESERQLQQAGFGDALHLEEALVYASYDEDDSGRKLQGLAGRVPRQAAPFSRHHACAPLQTDVRCTAERASTQSRGAPTARRRCAG